VAYRKEKFVEAPDFCMGRADGNIKQPLPLQSIIHEKKSEEKMLAAKSRSG